MDREPGHRTGSRHRTYMDKSVTLLPFVYMDKSVTLLPFVYMDKSVTVLPFVQIGPKKNKKNLKSTVFYEFSPDFNNFYTKKKKKIIIFRLVKQLCSLGYTFLLFFDLKHQQFCLAKFNTFGSCPI